MTKPFNMSGVVHRVFSFEGGMGPFPITEIIEDEGWDEFTKIMSGNQDPRDEFKHRITLRRIFNPKVKLCDVIYMGSRIAVSPRFKKVIEEYDHSCIFYPVFIEDEKGNLIPEVEYYIFETLNFPGGEWVKPHYWHGHYNTNFTLTRKQVEGHHVFRVVLNNEPMFISEELKNRLTKEKFKYADYKMVYTGDYDWVPDEDLAPFIKWISEDKTRLQDFVKSRIGWVSKFKPEWLANSA